MVILIIVISFTAIVLGLYFSITSHSRIKRVEEMRRKHISFKDTFGKLGPSEELTWKQLKRIASVSEDEMRWRDEAYKKREERKRIEKANAAKFERIKQNYPHGVKLYGELWPSAKHIDFIQNKAEIKRLDLVGQEHEVFDNWFEHQKTFAFKSRKLRPKDWGCYSYDVNVKGIDEVGNEKSYPFKIWQHFYSSYCQDNSLDYSFFEEYKSTWDTLEKFRLKQQYYLPPVYDDIMAIVQGLTDSDQVIVLLSGSADWPFVTPYPDSLVAFHFEYLRDELDKKGIKHWNDEYDNYSIEDNQCIVIVELDTSISCLEQHCDYIFEKFKDKKPCITYISLFKEFSSSEMSELIDEHNQKVREEEERQRAEAERRRAEEEMRRQEEERQRSITNSLKSSVSSWGNVPHSDLHHDFLIRYYPTTCEFEATEREWYGRQLIWSFKNDPNRLTRISYQEALDTILPRVKNRLRNTFGDLLPNLTLVCIPASSPAKNTARYETFSRRLCSITGMENAYSHIVVNEERMARHVGGGAGGTDSITFDEDFFKGKNILLFDDVLTRGDSMRKFNNKMTELGANVIAGFTIGKTFHNREEAPPPPPPSIHSLYDAFPY